MPLGSPSSSSYDCGDSPQLILAVLPLSHRHASSAPVSLSEVDFETALLLPLPPPGTCYTKITVAGDTSYDEDDGPTVKDLDRRDGLKVPFRWDPDLRFLCIWLVCGRSDYDDSDSDSEFDPGSFTNIVLVVPLSTIRIALQRAYVARSGSQTARTYIPWADWSNGAFVLTACHRAEAGMQVKTRVDSVSLSRTRLVVRYACGTTRHFTRGNLGVPRCAVYDLRPYIAPAGKTASEEPSNVDESWEKQPIKLWSASFTPLPFRRLTWSWADTCRDTILMDDGFIEMSIDPNA